MSSSSNQITSGGRLPPVARFNELRETIALTEKFVAWFQSFVEKTDLARDREIFSENFQTKFEEYFESLNEQRKSSAEEIADLRIRYDSLRSQHSTCEQKFTNFKLNLDKLYWNSFLPKEDNLRVTPHDDREPDTSSAVPQSELVGAHAEDGTVAVYGSPDGSNQHVHEEHVDRNNVDMQMVQMTMAAPPGPPRRTQCFAELDRTLTSEQVPGSSRDAMKAPKLKIRRSSNCNSGMATVLLPENIRSPPAASPGNPVSGIFAIHQQLHEGYRNNAKLGQNKCEEAGCRQRFKTLTLLKKHLTKCHHIVNPLAQYKISCSFCGFKCKDRDEHKKHQITCRARQAVHRKEPLENIPDLMPTGAAAGWISRPSLSDAQSSIRFSPNQNYPVQPSTLKTEASSDTEMGDDELD